MSRVGKKPIPLPGKVKVTYTDGLLVVEGQKGKLTRSIHPEVQLQIADEQIVVTPNSDNRKGQALRGLTRSLVANMVTGVDAGFERVLEINGIGYRAEVQGNRIVFNLGYSHPIHFDLPDGITAAVDKNNVIRLAGIDKELVGQTAARIRELRPPEPYKGKGVKYQEEYIQRKAGKAGTK
jgi:large subunit ribosomal protein L6